MTRKGAESVDIIKPRGRKNHSKKGTGGWPTLWPVIPLAAIVVMVSLFLMGAWTQEVQGAAQNDQKGGGELQAVSFTPEITEGLYGPTNRPTEAVVEETDTPALARWTEEDLKALAQVIHEESAVLAWRGDRFGVSYKARQAAVAWCALNRLDAGTFGDTLEEVLKAPNQFAYKEDAPVTPEMLWLAEDVLRRWSIERITGEDAGRTLPSDYLFFEGDGKENYFRKEYRDTGEYWDWSLPDPYGEG